MVNFHLSKPLRRRSPVGVFAVGVAFFAAACSSGSAESIDESGIALGSQATATSANSQTDDSKNNGSSSDDAPTDDAPSDDAPTNDAAIDETPAVSSTAEQPADTDTATRPVATDASAGGPCTGIQFPLDRFASVHGIDADDPDRGLNLRTLPDAGSPKVGILPTGSVVEIGFHSDVRCATDLGGNVWWYVYGDEFRGWANTAFLAEHPEEEPPAELVTAARPDDRAPGPETGAGPCVLAQFPQTNYADVANIPDDDADGGLNLRSEPSSRSEKVGTLSVGTNVATSFHADVRCATDADGNIWWYVYGDEVRGWANTAFLLPT